MGIWLTCICRQEVLLLESDVVFHEALIEEREQGIREIQQQIGDVHEMFKDLAVLVHEQGVIIGMLPYYIHSHTASRWWFDWNPRGCGLNFDI